MKTNIIRKCGALCASVCLLFASLLTSGCAITGEARGRLVARIAVQYAVGKVVENNPGYAPRIAQIAAEVGAAAGDGASASVGAVMALARAKVDFSRLSPADVALVNTLLSVVEAELEARVAGGALSGELALRVKEVAGWIEEAARWYTKPVTGAGSP